LEIKPRPIFGALGTDPRCSVAEDFSFLPKSNCVTVSVQLAGIGLQFNIQAVTVRKIYAIIAMLPSLALADVQWVKIWEGDMALPTSGSAHFVIEADAATQKR